MLLRISGMQITFVHQLVKGSDSRKNMRGLFLAYRSADNCMDARAASCSHMADRCLLADHDCEVNGIDSLCFFGDNEIFGTYLMNGKVMLGHMCSHHMHVGPCCNMSSHYPKH